MSQQEDDLRALAKIMDFHGGAVPFHPLHETICRPPACPVLSGDKGREGRENHVGENLGGPCRGLRAVLPQLVDTGPAIAGGGGDGTVYPGRWCGLCIPADGRSVVEPPVEAQPHG